MIAADWRHVAPAALAPLYAREREQALRALQWDFTEIWHEVEQARTTWGLPGVVARDAAGRLRGMAFYVRDGRRVDLGGVSADDAAATGALLDAVLDVAGTIDGCTIRMLIFATAPGLTEGLAARGFAVQPHLYLSRSLSGPTADPGEADAAACRDAVPPSTPRFDVWRDTDIVPSAGLLRRAYPPADGALFAATNAPAEWEHYVSNLVMHPGCGRKHATATVVLRDGPEIRALAMVTKIAPRVAHLVQLAVDPGCRGRGLGRALVEEACRRLARDNYRALTLLVAGHNQPARSLYDAAGFREAARFVGATRAI